MVRAPSVLPKATPASTTIRLLLAEENGRLRGAIQRGHDTISPWSVYNVPADIVRFLASNSYYESSPRYFETFLTVTEGRYPIIHCDAEGREIELTYRDGVPRRACLTFASSGDEVLITRTLDGSAPISETALIYGQLLFDPDGGGIYPLVNREAWRVWDSIIDELEEEDDRNTYTYFGEDGPDNVRARGDVDEWYDRDEDDEYDDRDEPSGLRRIPHGMAVSAALFNAAAIRLDVGALAEFDETFFFLHNGTVADTSRRAKSSYQLNIPSGITEKPVILVPSGMDDVGQFPFSGSTFWFFDPAQRSRLTTPLKAKKRVRAIMEGSFTLVDVPKNAARNTILRSILTTLDFAKRTIKRETKKILTAFAEQCDQQVLLVRVASDGWHFAEDDRRLQAHLLRIMFEMFGAEAFSSGPMPGEVKLSAEHLLRELPQLAARLQKGGFPLLLENKPISAASWEFHLDATSSSIDWFELRPEIRCDGELLNDDELRGLLEGNTILRRDGRLMLLDEVNAQVLAMFAGTIPAGKRRRKGEQELIRVPRLQILDWLQLRSHGVTVTLSPEDARVLESLLNFETIPKRPIPAGTNRHPASLSGGCLALAGFPL